MCSGYLQLLCLSTIVQVCSAVVDHATPICEPAHRHVGLAPQMCSVIRSAFSGCWKLSRLYTAATSSLTLVWCTCCYAAAEETVATATGEDAEQLAAKQIDSAVEIVAEMQLTCDGIRVRYNLGRKLYSTYIHTEASN